MKAIYATLALSGLFWVALSAQTPIPTSVDVAFEVASVRPNNSGAVNSSTSGRGGSFTATNVTAHQLIIYAYRLRPFQLASGPRWIGSDRFDIQARPPENAKPDNPAMTRALLRDRFKLVAHTETRQEQVYGLVLARGDGRLGPQLKPSTQNCAAAQPGTPSPCGMNTSTNDTTGRLVGTGQSMEQLAAALGGFGLNRMVLDRTGLTGSFDIELKWTPDNARNSSAQSNDAPSIFAALQEQLGLRLDSQRGPVEFLLVDSIERPTLD
ncbi:MAG: TIGR03435 family protein [Vicinamibacterales bacterium]